MTRRKPRNKRGRALRGTLLKWGLAAGILLIAALGTLTYIDRQIFPLLAGGIHETSPTKIYSSPLILREGRPATPLEIRERLKRLNYTGVSQRPQAPGEYREGDSRFSVFTKPFKHPLLASPSVRAEFEIRAGRISNLRLADTSETIPEIALEPELLYEISGSAKIRNNSLKLSDVPPVMLKALIAVEDRRFYDHPGIDARGIARAFVNNIRKRRIAEGGSTLTQQLARNLYLSPRRTLSRKIKEAFIALYLETRLSKREILRLYLENAYFGQNGPVSITGLNEASRHFFDKSPGELRLEECALLAGLLRSPNGYSPFTQPDKALKRRNLVLSEMREAGFLTAKAKTEAAEKPLGINSPGQHGALTSDYFLAYIQRLLDERYDDSALLTRGLTIYTTLDPWMQERARQVIGRAPRQAALIVLDPRSGAIRALVGGRDYSESPFDRATQALRQPGSAFKPFVYGAALQSKDAAARPWTPSSLLSDTTRVYRVEGGTWTPRNYHRNYAGPVPLREAFAHSLNAATVNLTADISAQRVITYAQNMGIRSPLRPELGIGLGTFEVTLLELTGAYCPFANGGFRMEPYGIEAISDKGGDIIEFHSQDPIAVLSPAEAYLMTDLLRAAVTEGTARSLSRWSLDKVAAGKTGTTNGGKDAWFVGFTPDLVLGVWTGSDLPAPLGITGASAALPLWAKFLLESGRAPALPKNTQDAWPKPEGIRTARIDPASGLLARSGCPKRRTEIFIAGSEPQEECPLHSGGLAGWFQRILRGK